MSKIKTILLDMDGVLIDFMGGVSEVFGEDVTQYHSWNVNELFGITQKEFWDRIHNHNSFWSSLQKYPWADHLIEICKDSAENVYLCTSPAMNSLCFKEKFESVEINFPEFKSRMVITNNKHLLANSDTLLIDDSDSNCKSFFQNGGRYILFPQTWNPNDTYIPMRISYIKQQINKLL